MSRIKGLANFSANFEPQIASPLDARSIVQYQSDLLLESTWQANDGIVYTYKGMLVSVVDDVIVDNNGLYILINEDYTQLSSWTKVSGGAVSGGTYIYDWQPSTSYPIYTPLVDNSQIYRVIVTGYTSSILIEDDVTNGYLEKLNDLFIQQVIGATTTGIVDNIIGLRFVWINGIPTDNVITISDDLGYEDGALLILANESGNGLDVIAAGSIGFTLMTGSQVTGFTISVNEKRQFIMQGGQLLELSRTSDTNNSIYISSSGESIPSRDIQGITYVRLGFNVNSVILDGDYLDGHIIYVANESSVVSTITPGGANQLYDIEGNVVSDITIPNNQTIGLITSGGNWFPIKWKTISGSTTTFIGLTDTPNSYVGEEGKFLAVSGNSVVFVDAPSASGDTYTNLNPTEIAVGGVPIGTTFSGLTPSQVFDMIFYPELFPTLVNPSSTFVLTQAGLQEIGLLIPTLNFSSTFNRGTITPAYGTSGFRSGLPNEYNYTGTGLSDVSSTLLTNSQTVNNYTVLIGAQNWTGSVDYDGGEQPLSNKGNNFNTPLAAGTTSTITRTITGVYPYFGTTVDITTRTKQTLALHNATYWQVNMVAESGGNKQTVWLPDAFIAITGIQFYNTVSSTWEWIGGSKANSLLTFTVTTTQIDVNGTQIDYDVYTHNGALIGARQLRFYTT